jgi:hypothetical protein
MKFEIPISLKKEHEELHAELAQAVKAGGRTGEAAKAVARLMHPHFVREEEIALPPLGLLAPLSRGHVDPGMADVVKLTDELEAELLAMLAEHKQIVAGLETLVDAAKGESKPHIAQFAERLMAHARTEEEVSYPAALLVGRYLKAVLSGARPKVA